MLAFGLTPEEFMLGLMGKKGEPSSGARQMPSHWSLRRANVVSHSSPVGTQTPHASGIGLGIKLSGDDAVVLTSIGEGSTSQGEWYEGVNWAAVHDLPVIFLVENNVYAISVHKTQQMAVDQVADKAKGLGLPGVSVDGLDAFAVHAAISEAAERARKGDGPTLVEVMVSRMTPHSSDDDDRTYRSKERKKKALTNKLAEEIDSAVKEQVEAAVAAAEAAPYPEVAEATYPVYVEDIRHG
jgi:2-oxoisovalerate dehydrogenase E1 component alpha subunit